MVERKNEDTRKKCPDAQMLARTVGTRRQDATKNLCRKNHSVAKFENDVKKIVAKPLLIANSVGANLADIIEN